MKTFLCSVIFFCVLGSVVSAQSSSLPDLVKEEHDRDTAFQLIQNVTSKGDAQQWLAVGIVYHNFADGNPEDIETAIDACEKAFLMGGNAEALAYWGSSVTLKAGWYSANGQILKATSGVSDGLEMIDRAVEMEPSLIDLRILRLFNSLGIIESSPFERSQQIQTDLDVLEDLSNPNEKDLATLIHYARGSFALWKGDWETALAELDAATRTDPESHYAGLAEDLLWMLEE